MLCCCAQVTTMAPTDAAPNKILFVQNLPTATTSSMLAMLFQQFPGYVETRMVDARPGIAFVEFENEAQATTALQGLQDFRITPTNAISISYAKQ
jgi:RNA recognition motif-containing protein